MKSLCSESSTQAISAHLQVTVTAEALWLLVTFAVLTVHHALDRWRTEALGCTAVFCLVMTSGWALGDCFGSHQAWGASSGVSVSISLCPWSVTEGIRVAFPEAWLNVFVACPMLQCCVVPAVSILPHFLGRYFSPRLVGASPLILQTLILETKGPSGHLLWRLLDSTHPTSLHFTSCDGFS